MKLKNNIEKTKVLLEGNALTDNEYKKYINGELKKLNLTSYKDIASEMKYEFIKNVSWNKIKDEETKNKKNKFDKLSESVKTIKEVAKYIGVKLNEGAIVQVDMPIELLLTIDSSNLPKFIVIGNNENPITYYYKGASAPDLYKIMTAQKGIIGKIIYSQGESDTNLQFSKELDLHIVKNQNGKRTILSVANIEPK